MKLIKKDDCNSVVINKFSNTDPQSHTSKQACKIHFLKSHTHVPENVENEKKIQIENPNQHIFDSANLSATELKQKYPLTYSSWKNMKSRCKIGYILSGGFAEFKSFLRLMGPRPSQNFTLDRIDNNNKNYDKDNCRWADKHTQNQNKSNNVYLTLNGETYTISAWAIKTNQKATTLYRRKKEGWSDEEVIKGKSSTLLYKTSSEAYKVWPPGKHTYWEQRFIRSGDECRWIHLLRYLYYQQSQIMEYLESTIDLGNPDSDRKIPDQTNKNLIKIAVHIKRCLQGIRLKYGVAKVDIFILLKIARFD